ncbi:MotA/TolQ/ExbB proton channel family protein [Pseudobacteriovorax antillogorgiicola]|uniref:Outer membrane transport energization protein ExbB n=1 Tax=Pseudobacteriovorax antillogorgiicola TaxID=1513793 RepID=A0A1Y6CIB5_9BACT|nr:MotA/TolQ/ExbB proton channel family protein [Pseudobacteriovorax antillogorgiicola]TCS48715.1 outer membrane transport energization protein ExbB [Pseudobacteriovorax antillogorgiicola]SMF54591.1 outer membrane transport energization protein ExbB [Pseudobacteriovorax antillogorgiicola]
MDLINQSLDLLQMGGWVTIPLLLSSALMWYAIAHRWMNLNRGYQGTIRKLVKDALADKLQGDSVVIRAARNAAETYFMFKSHTSLKSVLAEESKVFERELARHRPLLETLVMTAPLMGLLGTVIGMIETFESLGDMTLFTQSGGIAGGISQALITTQMGLIIAIPGLLCDRFLKRREELLRDEIYQMQEVVCQI